MLRANSRLRTRLEDTGCEFLKFAAQAINRILPHVKVTSWTESGWKNPGAIWDSSKRTSIRVTISIGPKGNPQSRSLTAQVKRRRLPALGGSASKTLDSREHDICKRIAHRISEVLNVQPEEGNNASLRAIRNAFDEHVLAEHVEEYHRLKMSLSTLLAALHTLSEQSYENKALTFGCILEPETKGSGLGAEFPSDFLNVKRYKALSDGFRTAYLISANGTVLDFVDLDRFGKKELTEKHYYPDWAEPVAKASRDNRCGIALSRQGDILIFEEGTLRFTYRYGKWQYWNHSHLVHLLRDRARAQRVPTRVLGRVVGAIYRAALDVSFRRSGGLFVILHNKNSVHDVVRYGDAIDDSDRSPLDKEFDEVIRNKSIQSLPRVIAVELASLDGAIVLENKGQMLAYGAVLQPKKSGHVRGSEGSRTKAAIGASNYGLAIKVSSDGDITVYFEGQEFIRM